MIDDMPSTLPADLDRLEAKGRDHLDRRDRRAARHAAWTQAMLAAPVAPALLFLAGWFAPLRVGWAISAVILLPLVTAAVAYVMARRRQWRDRQAALAMLDRQLMLKDRLRTADEFLALPTRSGFQAAAVAEAGPWIDRALTAALAPEEAALAPASRRDRMSVGGAAALLLAIIVQQWFLPSRHPGAVADALARIGATQPLRGARPDGAATKDAAGDGLAHRDARERRAAAADSAGGTPGTGENGANGGAQGDGGAGAPATGSPSAGSGGEGAAGAAAQPGSAMRSDPAGAPVGAPAADRSGGSEAARQAAARIDAAHVAASDGAPGRASGNAQRNDGSSGSPPPPSSAPSRQRPASGQGGNGSRPDPRNRSQPGSEGQSSPTDSGKGDGRQAPRTGEDALKSSHGLSALLLAVPMEDRLGAAANPGAVSSVDRRGTPRAGAATMVSAEGRGVANGDAGRIGHAATTPQERRLIGTVFRPKRSTDHD